MVAYSRSSQEKAEYPKWDQNPYGEPLTEDGEHNLPYWVWELTYPREYEIKCVKAGVKCPIDVAKRVKSTLDVMKASGIELSQLGSNGKETMLLFDQPDEFFEMSEAALTKLIEECRKLMNGARNHALSLLDQGITLTTAQKKRLRRAVRIAEGVLDLQRFCREEYPDLDVCRRLLKWAGLEPVQLTTVADQPLAWTWPLRIVIYVRRSEVPGWSPIIEAAPHLVKACLELGQAQWQGSAGCIIEMPPGHGKTMFGSGAVIADFARDRNLNYSILHHKSDDASDRLQNLKLMMQPDSAMGRRTRALFPHLVVERKRSTATEFFLSRESGSKDPSARSAGINEAAQGRDLHRIWADDIVDESERYDETQRHATHRRFTGTWLRRLRGTKTFWFATCTPWHFDDAYGRMMRGAIEIEGRDGRQVPEVAFVHLPVGSGSDDTYPLWDRYPRTYLQAAKRQLGSDALYSCLYRLDPRPDSGRIVSNLVYIPFDESACDEDRAFLATSKLVLSLDPTATAAKKSDRAGIVYAAVNAVERRILVLDAWEVSINQVDLAAFVGEFARTNPVHEILVESIGGFHATPDMLVQVEGIPEELIHRVHTKNADKKQRLMATAAMLQGGQIAFRGTKTEDGGVVPLERHLWLHRQILDFGACRDDHALDAVTQLGRAYASELWTGEPFAALAVEGEKKRSTDDQRLRSLIYQLNIRHYGRRNGHGGHRGNPVLEEIDFITCQAGEGSWLN